MNENSPLAGWEYKLLRGMGQNELIAIATFHTTDGREIVFHNVNVDSIGPSAENPGVIGVEFEDDAWRIVHIPFVSYWEIDYQ